MFDAGLFEMLVIFTLGLLVLGPERLPRVARFVGRWVGQARRAVTRLNSEIERELALEEIRKFQQESSEKMRDTEREYRDGLKSMWNAGSDGNAGTSASGGDAEDGKAAGGDAHGGDAGAADKPAAGESGDGEEGRESAQR